MAILKYSLISNKINEWNLCKYTNKDLNGVYLKRIYFIIIFSLQIVGHPSEQLNPKFWLPKKVDLVIINDRMTAICNTVCRGNLLL